MKKVPIEYFDKETGTTKRENIYITDNEYYSWNKNKKNNSAWLEAYMEKHQELEKLKNNKNINIKKTKGKAGRTGKFKSEQELHQKILSIPNWKTLSKNLLAKKIGYQSSSGLNELLKTKKWSLPSRK